MGLKYINEGSLSHLATVAMWTVTYRECYWMKRLSVNYDLSLMVLQSDHHKSDHGYDRLVEVTLLHRGG